MRNTRSETLVDEKTGQEYFHPKTGRAPLAKRVEPASDRLYMLRDVKDDTIKRLSSELLKDTLNSMKLTINKDSINIAEKSMNKAIFEIISFIDPGNTGIIIPSMLSTKGILFTSFTE